MLKDCVYMSNNLLSHNCFQLKRLIIYHKQCNGNIYQFYSIEFFFIYCACASRLRAEIQFFIPKVEQTFF